MLLYLLLGIIAVGLLLLSVPGKNILWLILIAAGVLIVIGFIIGFLGLVYVSPTVQAIIGMLVFIIIIGRTLKKIYISYQKKELKGHVVGFFQDFLDFLKTNKKFFIGFTIVITSPLFLALFWFLTTALRATY